MSDDSYKNHRFLRDVRNILLDGFHNRMLIVGIPFDDSDFSIDGDNIIVRVGGFSDRFTLSEIKDGSYKRAFYPRIDALIMKYEEESCPSIN